MLIDKGCEIVEFDYKKMDLDFARRTLSDLNTLKYFNNYYSDNLTLTNYYIGGMTLFQPKQLEEIIMVPECPC